MKYERGTVIHYRYCMLILILACIVIASDRWTGQVGFTDYLTNAATITSLLLGLIAIIYSFYSNGAISSSLGGISSAAKDVERVGGRISEYVDVAKSIEEAGKQNLSSLEAFSEKMNKGLEEFSGLLRAMDGKSNAMHDFISNLPRKLDDLERAFLEGSSAVKEKIEDSSDAVESETDGASGEEEKKQPLLREEVIHRFFDRSSVSEVAVAYCCVRSLKGKRIIDIKEISEINVYLSEGEIESLVRCMDALGLIEIYSIDEYDAYRISRINGYFAANAREFFCRKINLEKPAVAGEWFKKLDAIEANYAIADAE